MMRIKSFLAVVFLLLSAFAPSVLAADPVSPLYQAQLDATLARWELGASGMIGDGGVDVTGGPASVQPFSFCLASICVGSYCIGSACLNSECIGSGCVNSGCVGSGCVSSVCLGSGCVGSMCGGSACYGATMCVRQCGPDGPAIPQDPQPSAPTMSARTCPQP